MKPTEYISPETRKVIHAPENWDAELEKVYNEEAIEDFIVDTLAEIGQEHTEISDEARNGMQVFANRLLENFSSKSDEGGA